MRAKLFLLGFVFCLITAVLRAQTITTSAATGAITSCVGSASISPNLQQVNVTGNSLSSAITATAPVNFELSLSAAGSYSNVVTLPQTGGVVYVRAAANAPIGNISGNISFSSPGAVSSTTAVSAVITPLPIVNTVANQTVNAGASTAAINFTGTAPLYRWTNDNPNIGIGANGSGDIPSFTAINTGTNPVTANFTVTPAPVGFVFTTSTEDNSVSMINVATNVVKAKTHVGSGPQVALVNPNQKEVYVSCMNDNVVYILDALNGNVITTISGVNYPIEMITNADGSYLYVSNWLAGKISVIDTKTRLIVATIAVDPSSTIMLISPDKTKLYVLCQGISGNGAFFIINISDNTIISRLPVDAHNVVGMLSSFDGSRIYITDNTNKMSVINTLNNTIVASIALGNDPVTPVMTDDGSKIYVANTLSNNVSVINTATNSLVATIPVGNYPVGCVLSADGNWLYVSCRASLSVCVINTATNTVVKTIPMSGTGIYDPILSPDGSRIYVTDPWSRIVHVINTTTNAVLTDVQMDAGPMIANGKSISLGSGCDGTPISFSITVNQTIPTITTSGTLASIGTSYGTSSQTTSFTVSGSNLTSGITVTPPPGFEISTDNTTFGNTITVGGTGFTGPATVYIRLAKTTNAGTYSGNIVLSSPGVANVNINMPNSMVTPAILNISGTYGKIYGDVLTDYTLDVSTPGVTFNPAGLRNGNTFKSMKIAFGAGAAASYAVGVYKASVVTSEFVGDNGYLPGNYTVNYLPVDLQVIPATITLKGGNATKPYGATLTVDHASTNFTVTGLKNNETIGAVDLTYSAGGNASAAPGIYRGAIYASNPSGGTFNPSNYTIIHSAGDLTILAAATPSIAVTGQPSGLQTIYGTPSRSSSFGISGTNLTANILITSPVGFEISTDNGTFSDALTLTPGAGAVTATIYMRLKQTTPVGTYTGNLSVTSTGAPSSNVSLTGTVIPAPLTIAVDPVHKVYGNAFVSNGISVFKVVGLQNNESIQLVDVVYASGAVPANAPVGRYQNARIPVKAEGVNFDEKNYRISYISADVFIDPALLTITADSLSREFGAANPTLTFTYSGFVNGESASNLIKLPSIFTVANLTSPVGIYSIAVSGAQAQNYSIKYVSGVLTIVAAPLPPSPVHNLAKINVPNTFTPNADGVNDFWKIDDLKSFPNCVLEIYDRYGQHMYHSVGYATPWDGTFNNHELPFGTYYYIINVNDGITPKFSGYVAIVK